MAAKKDTAAATLEGLRQIGSGWHLSVATAVLRGDHKTLGMDRKEFAAEAGGFKLLDSRQAIVDLYAKGMSRQAIADVLAVDRDATVARVLYEEKLIDTLPKKAQQDRGQYADSTRSRGTASADSEDEGGTASTDSVDSTAEDIDAELDRLREELETAEKRRETEAKEAKKEMADLRKRMKDAVAKARKEWEDEQYSEEDRERLIKEAEAYAEEQGQTVLAAFAALGVQSISGDLERAAEHLTLLIKEGGLTADLIQRIEAALAAFTEELNVARAMIDSSNHARR